MERKSHPPGILLYTQYSMPESQDANMPLGVSLSFLGLEAPKSTVSSIFRKKDVTSITSIELQDQGAPSSSAFQREITEQTGPGPNSPTRELTESEAFINEEDLDFPEGGLQAWLAVFGSFMGLVPAFGMVNSVGAIESYVSSHQLAHVSASTVSWIFSMYTFIAFSSGIFSGAFFDRSGAFNPLLIGTVFFCGGLFATGSAKTVYQFILGFGVVVGFGTGMLMSPLCGVVSHYFNKKRATALSIATTGGSVGGIVMPLLLRRLYPSVGFGWSLRILSLICLLCLTCSLIFAKGRLQTHNEDPIKTPKQFFKVYFLDIFDYRALKEWKFVFCSVGVSLSECSLVTTSLYFPSYVIKRGYSSQTAFLLITVINTTGILGRYIPGYAADKFLGRFNVVILNLIGCVASMLMMWLPFGYDLKVLYAFAGLYGFFSGSILSSPPACCGQISRTEEFGKRYSTMYLFASFSMLLSILVSGYIIDDGEIHNYNNFVIFSAMMAVGGCAFYAFSRHCCVGFKLTKF